jgi:signal peptidase I
VPSMKCWNMLKISSPEVESLLRDVVSRGNYLRGRALGRSMYPLVCSGDYLLIEHRGIADLNVGDIVFFRSNFGTYITHRVIKKNGSSTIITRGDNTRRFDSPVAAERIIGRVVKIEGRGKRLKLTGWPSITFAYLISLFARVHFRGQVRVIRLLSRIWWLVGGRRIK